MINKWRIVLILSLGLLLVLFGTTFVKQEQQTLSVAAAANLTKSFTEIGEIFTKESGIPVSLIFGSTGQLTQQIKNGAPVDLFAAADTKSIEELANEKLIATHTIQKYAQGNLVLVPYAKAKFEARTLTDLRNPQIKIIAIANPETAPYGKAAKEILIATELWEEVKTKVVFGKNVDEVLAYVKTGNADVAFLAKSLVYDTNIKYYEDKNWPTLYQPIIQVMGIIDGSKNKDAAFKFAQFVLSPEGRKIMEKYGYDLP